MRKISSLKKLRIIIIFLEMRMIGTLKLELEKMIGVLTRYLENTLNIEVSNTKIGHILQ